MGKILISIKPQYANAIFDGTKKWELRKKIWRRTDIDTAIVYASHPTQAVIGEFKIEKLIMKHKKELWELLKNEGLGVTKAEYDAYSSTYHDPMVAIKIGEIKKYDTPKKLIELGVKYAPQHFIYF